MRTLPRSLACFAEMLHISSSGKSKDERGEAIKSYRPLAVGQSPLRDTHLEEYSTRTSEWKLFILQSLVHCRALQRASMAQQAWGKTESVDVLWTMGTARVSIRKV